MTSLNFNLIILTIIFMTSTNCSIINEHVKHTKNLLSSHKFTIEELLTANFPYADPRTDAQYDMDPCKSGKTPNIWFLLNNLRISGKFGAADGSIAHQEDTSATSLMNDPSEINKH
jgi:hypothetical protein